MRSLSYQACLFRRWKWNQKLFWRNKISKAQTETPLRRLLNEASSFGEAVASDPELQWATQPYTVHPQKQTIRRVEPEETSVILFPGQGSQFVGMGKRLRDVPPAKELYDLASNIVGWDVAKLCLEGPEDELTRRCQTCVLVTSLAALELVRDTRPSALERVRAAAGFSLGEITALVFAGALEFEQAVRLVEVRAAAMNAAAAERRGGMLTVWLHADAKLGEALAGAKEHAAEAGVEGPVCQVANYLYPQCKVVAGDEAALQFLERRGREWGVRRSARVAVSGAFHTPLMARAADALRAALAHCTLHAPRTLVLSAVDCRPYRDAKHVQRQLARQVCAPVQWEQVLHGLYARPRGEQFPLTLALGPGAAMRATLRNVNARAWDSSLQIDV